MTALVQAEVDGERLTHAEIARLLRAAVGRRQRHHAAHDLARDAGADASTPTSARCLLEDLDGRLPAAVEEFVRWASPVMTFRRTATRDVELHGDADRRRARRSCSSTTRPTATRRAFDDPWRFDVTRDPNRHLGFGGGGPHYCLGASLARTQLRSIFGELLTPAAGHRGRRARAAAQRLHPRRAQHGLRLRGARLAPGMAPDRDPRVDAYIDALPDWQQDICREVRELVHAADPEVAETIKRTRPALLRAGRQRLRAAGRQGPRQRLPLRRRDRARPRGHHHRRPRQHNRAHRRDPPRRARARRAARGDAQADHREQPRRRLAPAQARGLLPSRGTRPRPRGGPGRRRGAARAASPARARPPPCR